MTLFWSQQELHLFLKVCCQLKINGKLIIPVGDEIQKMTVITRFLKEKFDKVEFGEFQFVPFKREKLTLCFF